MLGTARHEAPGSSQEPKGRPASVTPVLAGADSPPAASLDTHLCSVVPEACVPVLHHQLAAQVPAAAGQLHLQRAEHARPPLGRGLARLSQAATLLEQQHAAQLRLHRCSRVLPQAQASCCGGHRALQRRPPAVPDAHPGRVHLRQGRQGRQAGLTWLRCVHV